jgi:hypothetical protein
MAQSLLDPIQTTSRPNRATDWNDIGRADGRQQITTRPLSPDLGPIQNEVSSFTLRKLRHFRGQTGAPDVHESVSSKNGSSPMRQRGTQKSADSLADATG